MFAAAAIVAQMAYDGSLAVARWIATKIFVIAIMVTVLPWVLRHFYVWAFDHLLTFSFKIGSFVFDQISTMTNGSYNFDIPVSGVGGYIALQIGIVDYFSIIITGWGIYWFICIFPRRALLLG